jgi:citrate synthase
MSAADAARVPPISTTLEEDIEVRGQRLARDLIGQVDFTTMFLLDLDGELPSPAKKRVVDSILVAPMEHGTTPSSLTTRLVLDGAPESLQGAVAAGLLATGSRFLGTIDRVAASVQRVAASAAPLDAAARAEVQRLGEADEPVPGVGHNLHPALDPRVERLLEVAAEEGLSGRNVEALQALHRAARAATGRPLVLNAAGAIGAILSDLGYEPGQVRGFALVARCAGLFAHAVDEVRAPLARPVWQRLHEEVNRPASPRPGSILAADGESSPSRQRRPS